MSVSIVAAAGIWLCASAASRILEARASRLLTHDQRAEMQRSFWEAFVVAKFLGLELLIVFTVGALVWSHVAAGLFFGVMVAMTGTIVFRDVVLDRQARSLALPGPYIKASRCARIVRSAGVSALLLLSAYAALRAN